MLQLELVRDCGCGLTELSRSRYRISEQVISSL
eukprot:SAG11_NODE_2092_length_3841_cov_2.213789_3_plen_33_part_00